MDERVDSAGCHAAAGCSRARYPRPRKAVDFWYQAHPGEEGVGAGAPHVKYRTGEGAEVVVTNWNTFVELLVNFWYPFDAQDTFDATLARRVLFGPEEFAACSHLGAACPGSGSHEFAAGTDV